MRGAAVPQRPRSSEPYEGLSVDFDDAELSAAANRNSATRKKEKKQPIGVRMKQDTSGVSVVFTVCKLHHSVLLRVHIWF